MTTNPLIELIILAVIWGASFIFMRIGSPEFGPVFFMAMRTTISSLVLLPIVFWYRQHKGLNGYKIKIFIVGLLNTAIPFVLFGYATLTLSAGHTSILNATTPMFGAIVAYFWLKDKLSASAMLGLAVGFLGVYILMYPKLDANGSQHLLPAMAVLGATLCYGISANFTKKYLNNLKPLTLAAGSQVAASIFLLPISLFYLPSQMPSFEAINSVILLGVICTAIAYILFFRLISALGPAKAISVTYMIPLFGIFWGAIFLQESINLWTLAGCGTILFGVALTTGFIKTKG